VGREGGKACNVLGKKGKGGEGKKGRGKDVRRGAPRRGAQGATLAREGRELWSVARDGRGVVVRGAKGARRGA